MLAKGVDFYTYIDANDIHTHVTAPAFTQTQRRQANFRRNNLQISSSNIPGAINYTGWLEFITRRSNQEVTRQRQAISSLTGNLDTGTMGNMFKTPPTIGNTTVCWGFYDAGSGASGITNQHQLYVYATRNHRNWMKDLAARNPGVRDGPFERFALPGAHDAGMFDMRAMLKILDSPLLFAALAGAFALIPVWGQFVSAAGGVALAFAPRGISNLSMTQKEDVRTMLEIGTRYFDFRPGTMHPRLRAFAPGERYHQHGMIPGYPYIAFLEDVLRWLHDNPDEIVVVSANTQGFSDNAMKPSVADLDRDLATALRRTARADKKAIQIGNKAHLKTSYKDLVDSNTRLIFLNQIATPHETSVYDSYYGPAHATLRPEPIIALFDDMKPVPTKPADYVVMQMQATATSVSKNLVAASLITTSDASSPLMATKAVMDAATNPWLRAHGAHRLPQYLLLVLLNDFVDNCMVETAIRVTEGRVAEFERVASEPFPTRRIPPRRPINLR